MTGRRGRRRPPWEFVALAALGALFAVVPIIGLLVEVPWPDLATQLTSDVVLDAGRVSLIVSLAATGLVVVLGLPLAWILTHLGERSRRLLRAVVLLPMVLPPVVGGTALLSTFGRRGFLGQWLDRAFGIALPFTVAGAVVAAAFVAMPFFVITVEAAIRQQDDRFAEAAATLGAGPRRTFARVTLPLVTPALGAGAALAWARALGEFGATITFNGSLGGKTQTLPLATFEAIESGRSGEALTLSLVLLVVSLTVLVSLRDHWLVR